MYCLFYLYCIITCGGCNALIVPCVHVLFVWLFISCLYITSMKKEMMMMMMMMMMMIMHHFLTKSSHITYVERTHLDICTMDWLCSRQAFHFSCLQNQRIISYIHRSTVTLLRAKIHTAVNLQ